jgi:LCP family protein required for cell wall assembly
MKQTPDQSRNSRFRKPNHPSAPLVGQDITRPKNQPQFPSIGMTLNSYQSSLDTNKTPIVRGLKSDKPRWKRALSKITPKRAVITILIALIVGAGLLGFKFAYELHKVFGGNIFDALHTATLNGEADGRVTILLAGNSSDDVGHQGADLTDSIMLISIDTKNNTAFLLSVPRDLYVNINNQSGYQKINDAYVVGQQENFSQSGYPNGGMGLLQKIVGQDFGIPIDYYALIDYSGIKEAVNAVGGIEINIQSSDPRGLYDPSKDYSTGGPLVRLSNGEHVLDGQQALDLARARGDAYGSYGFPDSDFDRTEHQRQMLVALKQKINTSSALANPIKLTQLFDAFGNNVTTNLNLSDARALYDITKKVTSNNIKSLSLNSADGQDLLQNYTSYDGESALVPAAGRNNYSAIQSFVAQQTSNNPVVQENASITVLNGTNQDGLAATFQQKLESDHYDVASIGDANTSDQATTQIIDNSKGQKPATLSALEAEFGKNVTTTNPYVSSYQSDFIIVLGNDQTTQDQNP